jgi:hypothetical protein
MGEVDKKQKELRFSEANPATPFGVEGLNT